MPDPRQPELPLPAPAAEREGPLVPARIVNEWVYCPRLAYLMWVEGEWAETGDTEDGRRVHARVDQPRGVLPPPPSQGEGPIAPDGIEEETPPFRSRSVTLASERLGIVAKMDLIEGEGGWVSPVDYKRGKRPHLAEGAYEPERVQICAQALILEDAGYAVEEGALWYAGSRERVRVALDAELRALTLRSIAELRLTAASGRRPPPLENSPKCPRCALAGICLPDEVNFFRKGQVPRMLNPADDPALPLHIQAPGARLRKSGEALIVEVEEKKTKIELIHVSEVALYGPVSPTTPALHELMRREIPVAWHSTGGWLMGHTVGTGSKNVGTRAAQFRLAADALAARRIAAGLVAAKIRNQRTMLRRNWKGNETIERDDALARLKRLAEAAPHAPDLPRLLGLEGEAAAIYFRLFERMIAPENAAFPAFGFSNRNRRPPSDPVNAMLSFAYALATRVFLGALVTAGFDPYQGFYHRPRHGRPALALDMMEPFRPLLCDSAVLMVINNGEIGTGDFVFNGPACALKPPGRRALIAAWERRLTQETTHPVFGYRVTMRRLIAVQCRLLARHVTGEIAEMPHYVPR
jgi:CRISPR-associated exonuclease Cas4/CRISPR-associated protein Cas1